MRVFRGKKSARSLGELISIQNFFHERWKHLKITGVCGCLLFDDSCQVIPGGRGTVSKPCVWAWRATTAFSKAMKRSGSSLWTHP